MADPRRVRPHELEILVARELRKAGLELSPPRVLSRRALSRDDDADFTVELAAVVSVGGAPRDLLIECRNEARPTSVEAVRTLAARLPSASSAAAPPVRSTPVSPAAAPRLGMMFSAAGYDPAAVREAATLGITLIAIADGPAAFRRSQWSMGAQAPAWVPEYMAELVEIDAGGSVRHRLIGTGGARVTLEPSGGIGNPRSGIGQQGSGNDG